MFRKQKEEDRGVVRGSSKLQAVFSKLTGVLPKPQEFSTNNVKTMSSDIIETVLTDTPVPPPPPQNCVFDTSPPPLLIDSQLPCLTITNLTQRFELELRSSKRTHLACGEVLLPCGLLYRIAKDVLAMAESEPCGIRGCLIYINFESLDFYKTLASIKCDQLTATTFELNLTLKQCQAGWTFIPQFIKNFGRGGTIVISPAYTLSKKKLYRPVQE